MRWLLFLIYKTWFDLIECGLVRFSTWVSAERDDVEEEEDDIDDDNDGKDDTS